VAIEVLDPATGLLTPLTARGVHAAYYLESWEPGETGVATWVPGWAWGATVKPSVTVNGETPI